MLELSGTLAWTPPIVETVATDGEGIDELLACSRRAPGLSRVRRRAHPEASRAGGHRGRANRPGRLDHALAVAMAGPQAAEMLTDLAERRLDPDDAAGHLVRAVVVLLEGETPAP